MLITKIHTDIVQIAKPHGLKYEISITVNYSPPLSLPTLPFSARFPPYTPISTLSGVHPPSMKLYGVRVSAVSSHSMIANPA